MQQLTYNFCEEPLSTIEFDITSHLTNKSELLLKPKFKFSETFDNFQPEKIQNLGPKDQILKVAAVFISLSNL